MSASGRWETSLQALRRDFDARYAAVAESSVLRQSFREAFPDSQRHALDLVSVVPDSVLTRTIAHVDRAPTGLPCVDLGAGRGAFARHLADAASTRVLAIDVSSVALKHASSHGGDAVDPLVADAQRLPLRSESVRSVVMLDVLPFVDDQIETLTEIHRVMCRGGSLSFTAYELVEADPSRPWATTDWRPWVEQAGLTVDAIVELPEVTEALRRLYGQWITDGGDVVRGSDLAADLIRDEAESALRRLDARVPVLVLAHRGA